MEDARRCHFQFPSEARVADAQGRLTPGFLPDLVHVFPRFICHQFARMAHAGLVFAIFEGQEVPQMNSLKVELLGAGTRCEV